MTATEWTCANCKTKNTHYPPAEKIKSAGKAVLLTEMKVIKQAVTREVVVSCSNCHTKGKISVTTYEN